MCRYDGYEGHESVIMKGVGGRKKGWWHFVRLDTKALMSCYDAKLWSRT